MSPYDLLGYTVPGGTLLLSIFLYESCLGDASAKGYPMPLRAALEKFWPLTGSENDAQWPLSVAFLFGLVVLAYVVGHLVSSVSSLVIDRLFIHKGYGYPYERLLLLGSEAAANQLSRPFHRGMFFWASVYFFLRSVCMVWPSYALLEATRVVGCYALGIVVLKWLYHIKPPGRISRWLRLPTKRGRVSHGLAWWVRGPHAMLYEACARPLALVLGTQAPFDASFCKQYRKLFVKRFHLKAEESGSNNFWFSYCFVVENSPELSSLLGNWLRLYSFSRNLAIAFLLAFGYAFTVDIRERPFGGHPPIRLSLLTNAYLLLAGVFLLRYVYLYVGYFTKFTFRAFVITRPAHTAETLA